MPKAVGLRHKIIDRVAGDNFFEQFKLSLIPIGEEHRTRIRIRRQNVTQTVVFLILAGQLVLLDDVVKIILGGDRTN